MPGSAPAVSVTNRQKGVLEAMIRAPSTSQQLTERARIVLMSSRGKQNLEQAATLGVDRQRVRRWRKRWTLAEERLAVAEQQEPSEKDLHALIAEVLSDAHRCGGPPTFTPKQVADLIALACEPPADSGLPVSHWTPTELAREAVKRGIVERISPRQVDRFLARRACGHTSRSIG